MERIFRWRENIEARSFHEKTVLKAKRFFNPSRNARSSFGEKCHKKTERTEAFSYKNFLSSNIPGSFLARIPNRPNTRYLRNSWQVDANRSFREKAFRSGCVFPGLDRSRKSTEIRFQASTGRFFATRSWALRNAWAYRWTSSGDGMEGPLPFSNSAPSRRFLPKRRKFFRTSIRSFPKIRSAAIKDFLPPKHSIFLRTKNFRSLRIFSPTPPPAFWRNTGYGFDIPDTSFGFSVGCIWTSRPKNAPSPSHRIRASDGLADGGTGRIWHSFP